MTDKDYRVVVRVKNNLLYAAMERAGIESVAELSRLSGVGQVTIGHIANLKETGKKNSGEWRKVLVKISEVLKTLPEDLMPAQHHYAKLAKNKAEMFMSFDDVSELLESNVDPVSIEEDIDRKALPTAIATVLKTLSPRQEMVLRMRFGLAGGEPKTHEQIAKVIGVGAARVAQLEGKALRQLKHPSRVQILRSHAFAVGCATERPE